MAAARLHSPERLRQFDAPAQQMLVKEGNDHLVASMTSGVHRRPKDLASPPS